VVWSPTGRSIVLDGGPTFSSSATPFQWIDLESGTVRVWLAPSSEANTESARIYRWEGETPFLYTTSQEFTTHWLVRYSIPSGAREILVALPSEGHAIGWTPDFETVFVDTAECIKVSNGLFGSNCIEWSSSVYRFAWRSRAVKTLLRDEGDLPISGRLSPNAEWMAFSYRGCWPDCQTPRDGIYVVSAR
jgi:hypothetical protein